MPKLLTESVATMGPAARWPAGGLHDPQSTTTYLFDAIGERIILIGRRGHGDIGLSSSSVSKRHATVTRLRDGRAILCDFQSHNGTFVNGKRIDGPVELTAGMQIHLGSQTLLMVTTSEGDFPISARHIPEFCYLARLFYGNSTAAMIIRKSRKFIDNYANQWRDHLMKQRTP